MIVATIVTNLLICHVVEPFVLYRYSFESEPWPYYVRNYVLILGFVAALIVLDRCMVSVANNLGAIFLNGCISVVISLCVSGVALFSHPTQTRQFMNLFRRKQHGTTDQCTDSDL